MEEASQETGDGASGNQGLDCAGPGGPGKEFGLCSMCNGKLLKCFKQGNGDIMILSNTWL